MLLSTFGYAVLVTCAFCLVVSMFRRANWLVVTTAAIFGLGLLLCVAVWWRIHYMPTPYGAGVMIKFDDAFETEIQVKTLINIFTFALPLVSCGIGGWLRPKITALRVRRVQNQY